MPRRTQVRRACEHCRRKRTKCDGVEPCATCDEGGYDCVYSQAPFESKNSLRSEIEQLKAHQRANNTLLGALSSGVDFRHGKSVLERLRAGEARESIVQSLGHESLSTGNTASSSRKLTTPIESNDTSPSSCGATDYSTVPSSRDRTGSTEPTPFTPTSSVELQDASDEWTKTSWSKSYTRELLDLALAWEFTPFCLLDKALFYQHYESGMGGYCSTPLVYALLALAAKLCGDRLLDAGERVGMSDDLHREAVKSLREASSSSHYLANVQAIGILSLSQLSSGHFNSAHSLAQEFAAAITGFCLDPNIVSQGSTYKRALATTYCGAISLNRLLCLCKAHPEDDVQIKTEDGSPSPNRYMDTTDIDLDLGLDVDHMQSDDAQFITIKMFQITEWVYKLSCYGEQVPYEEVLKVYERCLDWYSPFFSKAANESSNPSSVFIHIYFQLCVLSLFSKFIGLKAGIHNKPPTNDKESGNKADFLQPQEICQQAEASISRLTSTYGHVSDSGKSEATLNFILTSVASMLGSASTQHMSRGAIAG